MSLGILAPIAVLAVMGWVLWCVLSRLVSLLRVEHVRRVANSRRHTWRDTLAILGFIVVFFAVAATGTSDKNIIRLLLVAIAVWYAARQWKERRQGNAS